jgi:hypothetical protein
MNDRRRIDDSVLDGNALGGVLSEVFAADLTMADTTCAGCHGVAPLATLRVYVDAPAAVARCSGCGAVQLRVLSTPDRYRLDLSGVSLLDIPRGALPD